VTGEDYKDFFSIPCDTRSSLREWQECLAIAKRASEGWSLVIIPHLAPWSGGVVRSHNGLALTPVGTGDKAAWGGGGILEAAGWRILLMTVR
jgi:hypothetical protein